MEQKDGLWEIYGRYPSTYKELQVLKTRLLNLRQKSSGAESCYSRLELIRALIGILEHLNSGAWSHTFQATRRFLFFYPIITVIFSSNYE